MTRKLLLASMKVGGGHTALRDSYALALRRADPEGSRFEVELWECAEDSIEDFYKTTVRHIPSLQAVLATLSNSDVLVRLLLLKERKVVEACIQKLQQHQPEIVVSTHIMLTVAFVMARNELGVRTRIVTAIPDYGPPRSGFFPRLKAIKPEHVIVMEETAHEHLQTRRELPPSVLHFSGFLTREPFSKLAAQMPRGRFGALQKRNLVAEMVKDHPQLARYDVEKPTLIFLGGSAWTEKTLPVLERLIKDDELCARTNVLVVSGSNPHFLEKMTALAAGRPNIAVFGFVSPVVMAQLIALADYPVLGSLAPATLHELLELRCGPLLLHHFIPGMEKPHVPYIEREKVGLYEPDPDRMLTILRQATGIEPATAELRALIDGFGENAIRIRTANKTRSARLIDFLEAVARSLPTPYTSRMKRVGEWFRRVDAG